MQFSIITGTYNQKEHLAKLFESLSNQTYKDLEWIVCDDGSTDGTGEYIKSLKADFPIKYVSQKNKGARLAKNLNNGIKLAEGLYCVFVMGDSYLELNYLENLVELVGPDFLVCGIRMQVDGGKLVDVDWRLKKGLVPSDTMLMVKNPHDFLTGNGLTVPLKAFYEHGLWDESFGGYGGEDVEIIARLYFNGYLCWSSPALALYHHWHKSNMGLENIKLLNSKLTRYAK